MTVVGRKKTPCVKCLRCSNLNPVTRKFHPPCKPLAIHYPLIVKARNSSNLNPKVQFHLWLNFPLQSLLLKSIIFVFSFLFSLFIFLWLRRLVPFLLQRGKIFYCLNINPKSMCVTEWVRDRLERSEKSCSGKEGRRERQREIEGKRGRENKRICWVIFFIKIYACFAQ